MANWAERVEAMRRHPLGVRFAELLSLVKRIGYERDGGKGSHLIFRCAGLPVLSLQRGKSSNAKPYQVRQVLAIIDEHGIKVE